MHPTSLIASIVADLGLAFVFGEEEIAKGRLARAPRRKAAPAGH